ncbi:unnamed protein product [Bursaphelenchus xylophilus]|uniref:(pine wood nematode) hypothetical protein n=1 Tax=Bursaphelenchus xylophilus TaxID=6326 RepID=A0A1I7RJD5_BURXY|nr:unnamed protein product [Bursaphelenchus xylophilus]CAG9128807.1 unnamed protein product [Bursaphelenchus xylophilus]
MLKFSVIVLLLLVVATNGKALENETKRSVHLVLGNEKEELPLSPINRPQDEFETLELSFQGLEDLTIDFKLVGDDVLEMRWNWKRILCRPCKSIFNVLKRELKDGAGLTKEALKNAINNQCKKHLGRLVGKVCSKLGGKGIDALYDLIVKEDKRIDPQRCCKKVGLCK